MSMIVGREHASSGEGLDGRVVNASLVGVLLLVVGVVLITYKLASRYVIIPELSGWLFYGWAALSAIALTVARAADARGVRLR